MPVVVKPNRVTRRFTQRLVAPPEVVFPLLCPLREAEWIDGWDPVLIVSSSGVAEPDCVFTTGPPPGDAIWYITHHEAAAGRIEFLKITPGITACRITIQLRVAPKGSDAEVTYAHTSLGPAGDAFVESFSESHYRQFMEDWESRINHYLRTGSMLRDG